MIDHEEIKEVVQNIFQDIRAETVLADLLANGMNYDDVLVRYKGLFKRRYARDIDHISEVDFANYQRVFEFYINRDGLYDSLPQGLFHKKSGHELDKGRKFSEDSKELKREENEARLFFLPFENEIFYQRVKLEQEEQKVLSRFSEKIFNDIYPELWNLHRSIDREYIFKMVLYLHLAHKIAGNLPLTAKCLESIIGEPTKVVKKEASGSGGFINMQAKQMSGFSLGKAMLGVNSVTAYCHQMQQMEIEFQIGPLQFIRPKDFLEDAPVYRFLQCFYSYFIPVEFEVHTRIIVDGSMQNFSLKNAQTGPVLGYETAI
ncbi:hypothetical protein [uncultured Draconibacterium sp.]|uniref:hypothetical protein n=1 Tax=uncultured Draconibacterium sp. TaxID=1573823 RepID=UPI003261CAB4